MKDVVLNSGKHMPQIGFGTWNLHEGNEAIQSTLEALRAGYRLIDTARIYGNEASIGQAIKDSDVNRDEIFLSTKLWNRDRGYETALQAFDLSLQRLGLEYIDLYLIHWPGHDAIARAESWRALSDIYQTGKARSVGVSNFTVDHLEELRIKSDLVPAVNQIEFHPFVYEEQLPVFEYCVHKGIAIQAYSPLDQGKVLKEPIVQTIATELGKTPAQIILRWCIQHGTVPLPKSAHSERIRENLDVNSFELSKTQMKQLDGLSGGRSPLH